MSIAQVVVRSGGTLLKVIEFRSKPRMSAAEFMELYRDHWLRKYLIETARAMAKRNYELGEDLLQEAWLRIDTNPAGLTSEYYAQEGFRAMDTYYQREVRQWRLTRDRQSQVPAFRRARIVAKRFFKKRLPGGEKSSIEGGRAKSSRLVSPVLFQPHNPKSGPFRSVTK